MREARRFVLAKIACTVARLHGADVHRVETLCFKVQMPACAGKVGLFVKRFVLTKNSQAPWCGFVFAFLCCAPNCEKNHALKGTAKRRKAPSGLKRGTQRRPPPRLFFRCLHDCLYHNIGREVSA